MKQEQLLFGPFAEDLPNFALVDIDGKPTTRIDFAEATEGLESPWGMAQLTFFGDGAKLGDAAALDDGASRSRPQRAGPHHLSRTARFPRHHLREAGAGRDDADRARSCR